MYAASCGLFPDTAAWSELEIRAGLAPIEQLTYSLDGTVLGKIPDVLVELADERLTWVEVENSWRSDKDLKKVVASMRAMTTDKRIAGVHFVTTAPGAKTIGSRLRKALTHGSSSAWPRQVKELDARIVAQYVKVFSLNSETMELLSVAF